ncbi:cytochrome P450 734A5-like [Nymphaea colorata]|nr:cytochrome P450 734A5-like [Nymphaea colorata]
MSSCEAPYTLLGFLLSKGDIDGHDTCFAGSHLLKSYAVRQVNALLWISLIVVTGLLVQRIARLLRFWCQGSRLPGPPCPSFYGHTREIYKGQNPNQFDDLTEFLSKSHEQYGPVVRLWMGPTQLLVSVNDPELIKEMLHRAVDKLPLTGKAFRMAFGRSSLFASAFEKVRNGRKSLAMQLDEKLVDTAYAVPAKVVDPIMENIDSFISEGVHDCRSVSQQMSFSILGATLFGDAFLVWAKARMYEELLMTIAKDACFWASYKIPPFWKKSFWRYQHLCKRLKQLTQDILLESKHQAGVMNPTEKCSDNIASNINVFDSFDSTSRPENAFTRSEDRAGLMEESYANIMGVMFHGCLATAGLIGSVLARLVMHPEVQEKIYAEINRVGVQSSLPDAHEVQKMHFLLATVYESARLLPAGPLLQRCSLKHDLKLRRNITLPAGAILAVPVQLVQMDDSSWGSDAHKFNPDRFLLGKDGGANVHEDSGECKDAEGKSFVLNDPNANAAFLPFGSGARACVGQRFAILGIATLVACLVRRYEIRLAPGSVKDPKPAMNDCVLQLLPSPKITFISRDE